MEVYSDKCYLLLSCSRPSTVVIDGWSIESEKEVLLGKTIDRNLKFDDYFNNLCKKVCQKLNALSHLVPFMNVNRTRIIMKGFIIMF